VQLGADEVDVVFPRLLALEGRWREVYDDVRAMREACGGATLKVILAAGELPDADALWRTASVCLAAGADFLKTGTGKDRSNATLASGVVMIRALREYGELTGFRAGLKVAGGIRRAAQAWEWMSLVESELGRDGLLPQRFRIGSSTLLDDLEMELDRRSLGAARATDTPPSAS
jgi:deoxyribose-phosphate aldolase